MGKTWITKMELYMSEYMKRDHMAELPAMAGLFEWSRMSYQRYVPEALKEFMYIAYVNVNMYKHG